MAYATDFPVAGLDLRVPSPRSAPSMTPAITWRVVLRYSIIPIILMLLRTAPPPVNAVSYPLLALYSLAGRRQAILSLYLLFLFNTLNHGISFPPSLAALFRHFNVLAAAFSVLVLHVGRRPRSSIPQFLVWTAALSALLLAHSLIFSTMPAVSVLKAISYGLTIQCLLVAWSSLMPFDRELVVKQLMGGLIAVAVLSVPFIYSPIGYMRNQQGFQGILVHPQNFGPTMAYLATWMFASWLTSDRSHVWRLGLLALSLGLLYLSQARIAVAIFAVGLVAVFTARPLAQLVTRIKQRSRLRGGRLLLAGMGLALASAALGPTLIEKGEAFLKKGQKRDTVRDSVYASRAFIIEEMMANVRQRPLTGIGFGAPSVLDTDEWYGYVKDPFFGITIMAPVEKGVLPIAMIEEMGAPLASLFFLWMAGLYGLALRGGPVSTGICGACYATGIAEAMFFAPGGAGLQTLVFCTMAATTPFTTPQNPSSISERVA